MKKLILFSLVIFISYYAKGQCRILYNNYDLVFEENFDGINSAADLAGTWNFSDRDPGWGYADQPLNLTDTLGEYYSQSQVSIQPGGILRLTAVRVDGADAVWSDWLGGNRRPAYKSGMIMLKDNLWTDPRFDRSTPGMCLDRTGFIYGMFEIRVRLPNAVNSFPSFWLMTTGPTEIDIFEYTGAENRRLITNNIHKWTPSHTWCEDSYIKSTGTTLNQGWHTISCVWTPTKITFFFDGRETRTVDNTQIGTYPHCPGSILVNLAMSKYATLNADYMDVDYIRVYKPKQGNYAAPYKNAAESICHDVFENATGEITGVHSAANSIAPNTSNPNEVFYRGTNNYLYVATKTGSTWNIKKLLYNDGAPVLAAGDIKYLPGHDLLLYVGENNRINLFGRSTSTGTGFFHWYLTNNWGCYWCNTDDLISTAPGSLQTTPNGEVFYRGQDNKMHHFRHTGTNWQHQILSSTYNTSSPIDFVGGDIVVDPNADKNTVLYRGNDGRIQVFYKNTSGVYLHGWVGSASYPVNSKPGSMAFSPTLNGVLYAGTDNKLHLYYFTTSWIHQLIPYTYGSSALGYPDADYLNGSIHWGAADNVLYYVGNDGRVQSFSKSGSSWYHYWTDDYWNTLLFRSYDNGMPNKYSSIFQASNGNIFYSRQNGHLSYFKYEPCENLNPPCSVSDAPNILLKGAAPVITKGREQDQNLVVAPNPANTYFSVSISSYHEPFTVEVFNALGQRVINQKIRSGDRIDVRSLEKGVYVLRASGDHFNKNHKIIISH